MICALPGDLWLSLAFQRLGDGLTPVMSFFTWLGKPQAYMIAVAVIYWSVDRKLGLRLAIFLPVVASLNGLLKQVFHAPRPFWADPQIRGIQPSNGFGMPSGHAQASTTWMYAALNLKKTWFWIVAVATALMIGLSRIYLGVHFSSQVLAGWLIGILVLVLFSRLENRVLHWFLGRKFSIQLLLIAGITAGMLILGVFILYLTRDWQLPPEWVANAADDLAGTGISILSSRGLSGVAGNCGGFLGVSLGALLAHRKGGLGPDRSSGLGPGRNGWWRALRSVAGLVLLSALFLLFAWIEPEQEQGGLAAVWQFSGFFVLSFVVIFLFPLVWDRWRPSA